MAYEKCPCTRCGVFIVFQERSTKVGHGKDRPLRSGFQTKPPGRHRTPHVHLQFAPHGQARITTTPCTKVFTTPPLPQRSQYNPEGDHPRGAGPRTRRDTQGPQSPAQTPQRTQDTATERAALGGANTDLLRRVTPPEMNSYLAGSVCIRDVQGTLYPNIGGTRGRTTPTLEYFDQARATTLEWHVPP